jgi:transcriptional regulator with XRE-family HTH domain
MNTTFMIKEKLKNTIDHQELSLSEIEKGSGITRGSLRNFINGTVKEPRLEIILAVANFLKLDIGDMLSVGQENSQDTYKLSKSSNELLNEKLLVDCAKGLAEYVSKKKIQLTLEESMNIIKKVYNYSVRNNDFILDRSFLEWTLDELNT